LWFLDEPTTGQDPEHAVKIRELIRAQAQAGVTVFLTTHDMTVADKLCDRIALIHEGTIVVNDTPRNLKLRYNERVVRMEYRTGDGLRHEDFRLDDDTSKAAFVHAVQAKHVETIHTLEPSLEDVFLRLAGRGLM
jgi:fluoroquinolone transport system ATP-binding protein